MDTKEVLKCGVIMFDIELIDLTKSYTGSLKPAVKELHLQVEKGKIVSLLGPSGCGKTTTLRLIAGFERPNGGKIFLGGRIVSSEDGIWIPPEKRGVGMVFQDYALFPHLTVEENIGFGLKKSHHKKDRTREVITLVGLIDYVKRYPHELSGGQQQRVALARALAPRPAVILLDEPFSNLDAQLREHMRQEIRDIINIEGTTALFVTHDQREAFELSDHIVVMNGGIIEQQGAPRDLYLNPANVFVANFLGKSNILPGILEKDLTVQTEVAKICYNGSVTIPPGTEVKVLLRPNGLKHNNNGELKGVLKKLIFKGEIMEGIVALETLDNQYKEIIVYFHPYDQVQCGENVTLTILSGAAVLIK